MKRIEQLLSRVTMYTLTGGVLAVIMAAALVLSALGELSFSPLALIASSVVFAGVSYGANVLFGALYRVKPHLQSTMITAVLLTALFTPSLEVMTLVQYGLIAVIAQASKYLIAYRGRHIVNPAAFGALAGGLLSLQFASWWVATPPLFVLIAIGAFLVLYKTRQLQMGVLFLAIGWTLVTVNAMAFGVPLGEALTIALLSWPLLFIAGFMLTEPLTLPPRRWQKLSVAAVVAAITALPFSVAWFYSSPELALIVGNILAFILAFRQRRGLHLTLQKRVQLTPTVQEYIFKSPYPLRFEAGQYVEVTLPHAKADMRGVRRSFSVTNAPGGNTLALGVKFYEPSSTFKRALQKLPLQSKVQATGITGDFVLPSSKSQKLLFIAGGIGVTPFLSHLATMKDESRDVIVLYFARTPDELAYKERLDASDATVHYFVATDATKGIETAPFFDEKILKKFVKDIDQRVAYVSGPPVMVNAASKLLRTKAADVHTDFFSGY